MREIKFRAWSKCAPNAEYSMNYWKLGTGLDRSVFFDAAVSGQYGPGAVMQYTGLKDVKGREIYEGDIVVEEIETGKYQPFVVKWHDDYAGFDMSSSPCWTILGNIYENPELLK